MALSASKGEGNDAFIFTFGPNIADELRETLELGLRLWLRSCDLLAQDIPLS